MPLGYGGFSLGYPLIRGFGLGLGLGAGLRFSRGRGFCGRFDRCRCCRPHYSGFRRGCCGFGRGFGGHF